MRLTHTMTLAVALAILEFTSASAPAGTDHSSLAKRRQHAEREVILETPDSLEERHELTERSGVLGDITRMVGGLISSNLNCPTDFQCNGLGKDGYSLDSKGSGPPTGCSDFKYFGDSGSGSDGKTVNHLGESCPASYPTGWLWFGYDQLGESCPSKYPSGWLWFGSIIGWAPPSSWKVPSDTWKPSTACTGGLTDCYDLIVFYVYHRCSYNHHHHFVISRWYNYYKHDGIECEPGCDHLGLLLVWYYNGFAGGYKLHFLHFGFRNDVCWHDYHYGCFTSRVSLHHHFGARNIGLKHDLDLVRGTDHDFVLRIGCWDHYFLRGWGDDVCVASLVQRRVRVGLEFKPSYHHLILRSNVTGIVSSGVELVGIGLQRFGIGLQRAITKSGDVFLVVRRGVVVGVVAGCIQLLRLERPELKPGFLLWCRDVARVFAGPFQLDRVAFELAGFQPGFLRFEPGHIYLVWCRDLAGVVPSGVKLLRSDHQLQQPGYLDLVLRCRVPARIVAGGIQFLRLERSKLKPGCLVLQQRRLVARVVVAGGLQLLRVAHELASFQLQPGIIHLLLRSRDNAHIIASRVELLRVRLELAGFRHGFEPGFIYLVVVRSRDVPCVAGESTTGSETASSSLSTASGLFLHGYFLHGCCLLQRRGWVERRAVERFLFGRILWFQRKLILLRCWWFICEFFVNLPSSHSDKVVLKQSGVGSASATSSSASATSSGASAQPTSMGSSSGAGASTTSGTTAPSESGTTTVTCTISGSMTIHPTPTHHHGHGKAPHHTVTVTVHHSASSKPTSKHHGHGHSSMHHHHAHGKPTHTSHAHAHPTGKPGKVVTKTITHDHTVTVTSVSTAHDSKPTECAAPPAASWQCNGGGEDGKKVDHKGDGCPFGEIGFKWFGTEHGWQPAKSWKPSHASWVAPAAWKPVHARWWTPRAKLVLRNKFACPTWWPRTHLTGSWTWSK
ncbi:hypothetical protein RQP46_007159 [Phenoliferia psychrophenolica]